MNKPKPPPGPAGRPKPPPKPWTLDDLPDECRQVAISR
jgi:hypothetical protein